jgi:protein CpxP
MLRKLGKVKTLAIASVSALALAAPAVLAQSAQDKQQSHAERGEGKGHRRGGGGHRGAFGGRGFGFRGIELTDEQQARVRQIHDAHRESTKALHEQLRAKRQELRQLQEGATFNESLAAQKLTESAAVEARLMGEQFKLRQEMRSVLTAEQKAQMEQRRQQREQRREQFKNRRGERRGEGVSL